MEGFLLWIRYHQCLCSEIVAPQVVALIAENLPSVIVKARVSQFSLLPPISLWGLHLIQNKTQISNPACVALSDCCPTQLPPHTVCILCVHCLSVSFWSSPWPPTKDVTMPGKISPSLPVSGSLILHLSVLLCSIHSHLNWLLVDSVPTLCPAPSLLFPSKMASEVWSQIPYKETQSS